MSHKNTPQEVQTKIDALKKEIIALQNEQMHLNLLDQVRRHGVARSYEVWSVAGDGKLKLNP